MRKVDSEEKLKLPSLKIILIFVALFFVFEVIFYISIQHENFWPLETSFYYYTPILLVLSVVFCIISITQTYYKLDKHKITHVKMGKTNEYYFKDILYIDEEWSTKHKTLLFYLNNGRQRFLTFDKEGLIYEYALEYSHLISREEFHMRFPNVKL